MTKDPNELKELTPEQKQKFKALRKSVIVRGMMNGAKAAALFFIANFAICLVDGVYVHNQLFTFLGAMVTGFMIFGPFQQTLDKEHNRIKEEAKKILEE
jgi:hypothetical protein